jgi:DNA-binding FadR family transcriptional regulator
VQAFRPLAARRSVPQSARDALARHLALSADLLWRDVVHADFALHRAIAIAAGNARLARVHQELESPILLGPAQLGRGYASAEQLASERSHLLRAIESGRLASTEHAIREHLEKAATWLTRNAGTPGSESASFEDRHPDRPVG